jgi:hypothetical protein
MHISVFMRFLCGDSVLPPRCRNIMLASIKTGVGHGSGELHELRTETDKDLNTCYAVKSKGLCGFP